jgi:hypothetical protein
MWSRMISRFKKSKNPFESCPNEIIINIANHLNIEDKLSFALVDQRTIGIIENIPLKEEVTYKQIRKMLLQKYRLQNEIKKVKPYAVSCMLSSDEAEDKIETVCRALLLVIGIGIMAHSIQKDISITIPFTAVMTIMSIAGANEVVCKVHRFFSEPIKDKHREAEKLEWQLAKYEGILSELDISKKNI